jgi:hypothetical protein
MSDDLKKSQLHAIQYQHVDGSFELTFGGTMLLMAACIYLVSRLAHPDSSLLSFAPLLVFVGGVYLIDNLVQRFRRRVTYPRTGFITYRKPQPLKRSTRLVIWIGVPLFTVLFLALLFLNRSKFPAGNQDSALPIIPVFSGFLFSGLWVIAGWKIALPRFYLIAAATLLVSAGLFVSGVGVYLGMALLIGAMGVLLCVSGGVTLWKYLHANRPPEDPSPADGNLGRK